jgi:hypothetical protein
LRSAPNQPAGPYLYLTAGKLADQTAKNDDISVELLNLISEKKQVRATARRVVPYPSHTAAG